jgi:Cu+-exporting ATPase
MAAFPGTDTKVTCYHCGEDCDTSNIRLQEKVFCCQGCKTVYEIINYSGLCDYYDLSEHPGISQKTAVRCGKFDFLDNPDIARKFIHFREGDEQHVTFYLPHMHCSSCIWLLEHLPKLHAGILTTRVNFLRKEITVVFNSTSISLKTIATLLTRIGYEPHLSLNDLNHSKVDYHSKTRLYKLGIAGFCFGNIMLLSFPEYLSSGNMQEINLKTLFSFLNLGLSLPVFFYCASEFFISAYKGLRQKFLNIDAPIALAILITFARSVYEISSGTGVGYLDSMSGIVFFMLIGRFFQDRGYQSLHFERDYTSYFPIGVTVIQGSEEGPKPVSELKKEDRIQVHHNEIIPCDCILFMGKAVIDYSFVTGESLPIEKGIGEIIYAGGRQTGGAIELEVVKEVSQSYLTQLWNNAAFQKEKNISQQSFTHVLSRYFTYALFTVALVAGLYWQLHNPQKVWPAVTAVLIVACPCALLLSATFTNGNMMVLLQRRGFFVKSAQVLEQMRHIDTIIFDKTGTLSKQQEADLRFAGAGLNLYQQQLILSLADQSGHPLSRAIVAKLRLQPLLKVHHYREVAGQGSSGLIDGVVVKLGSARFVNGQKTSNAVSGSVVYVSINNELMGAYTIRTTYRPDLERVIMQLKPRYQLHLLSGDNAAEADRLRQYFGPRAKLLFNQQPQQKLDHIQRLQEHGKTVLMIGDGLNDAGALRQSNVGIAISDNVNNFSPGSDIIMDGKLFGQLPALLNFCRRQRPIIYCSFIISILYNLIGLSIAVQGTLSPVIAAILMPVSSLSIVLFTTLTTRWLGRSLSPSAIS